MAPDWSADVSRRRKIEHVNKKFDSTLSVYFFPFKISSFHFLPLGLGLGV